MAAPIIDSVVITPSSITPGGSADIKINAHDPDTGLVTLSGTVTDQNGEVAQVSGTVTITDALTFELSASRGTVVQDAADPSLFHFTDA